jgi:uncharacterized protein YecE (DUF72 family)
MLRFYATRLPSVELNNTFYRMPKREVAAGWAEKTPDGFRFAVKASRRITHIRRLKGADEEVRYLLQILEPLGERLGIVLFQTPPNLPKDLERLKGFLSLLPDALPAAFEFRHATWFEDDVLDTLREAGRALCFVDADDPAGAPLTAGAPYGYVRLRKEAYTDQELAAWAARFRELGWKDAFVYFKHEEECAGPRMAARFLGIATG